MRSIHNVIAGNSLAILLTVVCVLPITALLAFSATAPLDDATASLGLWLHDKYEWTFPRFDTEERFAKIGFAIRAVVIAVGISFLYFWITNWLNLGLARIRSRNAPGPESLIIEAIQPWIFVGPTLVLLLLFLLVPAFLTLSLSFQEASGELTTRNYAFLWDPAALGYSQFRLAMRNSLMWLVLVPSACISLGLLIAVLADSVRWGVIAKTFIFVPLAISFVGAAVIWRNIFAGGGIEPLISWPATRALRPAAGGARRYRADKKQQHQFDHPAGVGSGSRDDPPPRQQQQPPANRPVKAGQQDKGLPAGRHLPPEPIKGYITGHITGHITGRAVLCLFIHAPQIAARRPFCPAPAVKPGLWKSSRCLPAAPKKG